MTEKKTLYQPGKKMTFLFPGDLKYQLQMRALEESRRTGKTVTSTELVVTALQNYLRNKPQVAPGQIKKPEI